jgi:hypothetical protein
MKKFSLPKINLSKKQIFLICIPIVLVLLSLSAYLIIKQTDILNKKDGDVQVEKGLANDNEEARNIELQTYTPEDTKDKYLVYATVVEGKPEVEMIESCSYSDGTESKETQYYIGKEATAVSNHCLLTFGEYTGPLSLLETGYYNVYIQLPDGSLIVLTTQGTPSIQVNMYENETRIVLLNAFAYFRVAPQEDGKVFSVQMLDHIMYVTGTEFFTYFSEKYGHIELFEGSAEIKLRTQELLATLTNDEYAEYEGDWTNDHLNYDDTWGWYREEENREKVYTFTNEEVIEGTFTNEEGIEEIDYMDPFELGLYDITLLWYLPSDFVMAEIAKTTNTYGFGNYNTVASNLEAYVYETIATEQELRRDIVVGRFASITDAYENQQKWYDNLVEEGEEARAKAAAEAAASKGTTYSLCPSGTSYAGNNMCCPTGTYLGTDLRCHGHNNNTSSSQDTPTYNPKTPSISSSVGDSSDNCIESGTIAYQACKMVVEAGTNSDYYMSGGKCCTPEVEEPNLVPVE